MSSSGFQRYQLQDSLGQGGQGHTYRALDQQTGQMVAVKVIQLGSGGGWKPFELFERECAVLRSLQHPGIPRFLDTLADESQGRFGLVMELIEGQSLEQVRLGRPLLGEAQLWNLLHQGLEILDYLHGRCPPVIHRDLKPANLIRRPDGRLVLVDFGGVRLALRPDGGSTVVGTFGYLAPEQLHGEATPGTDLYGLGVTLAAVATGIEGDKLPRKGLRVDLLRLMAPSKLREVLEQLTEPEPEHRLASVAAVRLALTAPTAAAGATDASEAETATGEEQEPLRGLPPPLVLLLRVVGTVGFLGLAVLDALVLPLIFAILEAVWRQDAARRGKLLERKQTVRQALGNGRRAMKALAQGADPYHPSRPRPPRPLSPGPKDRPLPPGPKDRRLPRPFHRGRGRGRHGGRR